MAGKCGSCTLCCTVIKVEMEPPKPERTACAHCTSKGCAIYDDRPKPCEEFLCVWLASQEMDDLALPSALRPDRSGVVLEVNSAGYIVAHSERPASWKREPMLTWLKRRAYQTRVLIENGEGVSLLNPDGSIIPLKFVGVSAETNERLYKVATA